LIGQRNGTGRRTIVARSQTKPVERQRRYLTVIRQVGTRLKAAQSVNRIVAPLSVHLTLVVTTVRQRFLNLHIAVWIGMSLVAGGGRGVDGNSYELARSGFDQLASRSDRRCRFAPSLCTSRLAVGRLSRGVRPRRRLRFRLGHGSGTMHRTE
jgi:hypothetical protein